MLRRLWVKPHPRTQINPRTWLMTDHGGDPGAFVEGLLHRQALMARAEPFCAIWLVRQDCLEHASANSEIAGIWGGKSANGRRGMRQDRGAVERVPHALPTHALGEAPMRPHGIHPTVELCSLLPDDWVHGHLMSLVGFEDVAQVDHRILKATDSLFDSQGCHGPTVDPRGPGASSEARTTPSSNYSPSVITRSDQDESRRGRDLQRPVRRFESGRRLLDFCRSEAPLMRPPFTGGAGVSRPLISSSFPRDRRGPRRARFQHPYRVVTDFRKGRYWPYPETVTNQRIASAATADHQDWTVEDRYLDLVKRSLTRLLFPDESYEELPLDIPGWKGPPARLLSRILRWRNLDLVRKTDPSGRYWGRDWPQHGETMIGMARLENLQACVEQVLQEGVPGDLIETGVWRGGAAILMRAVLASRRETERTVWLADSFEGLPKPDTDAYPADAGLDLWKSSVFAVGVEEVKKNFERYALLDDQVKFLVGWFRDTLPGAPISQLAVLRLDGDLYESTMDALSALYPKLSIGGFLIVDDFHIPACAKAVEDYRTANSITEPIQDIDGSGAFWRREREF